MSALVIVGEAAAPDKMWQTALADEMEAAADEQFWLVLVPYLGDDSNAIYASIADWATEQGLYFDVVIPEDVECSIEAKETFISDDPYNYAVERAGEEGDEVKILVLLDEEDEEVGEFLAGQWEAGVPSFNLASSMDPLEFENDEPEQDAPEAEADEDEPAAGDGYNEEDLTKMPLKELRAIADGMGYDAAKTPRPDLVNLIMSEQGEPEPESEPAKKTTKKAGAKASAGPRAVTEDNAWKLALADAFEQVVTALRS